MCMRGSGSGFWPRDRSEQAERVIVIPHSLVGLPPEALFGGAERGRLLEVVLVVPLDVPVAEQHVRPTAMDRAGRLAQGGGNGGDPMVAVRVGCGVRDCYGLRR